MDPTEEEKWKIIATLQQCTKAVVLCAQEIAKCWNSWHELAPHLKTPGICAAHEVMMHATLKHYTTAVDRVNDLQLVICAHYCDPAKVTEYMSNCKRFNTADSILRQCMNAIEGETEIVVANEAAPPIDETPPPDNIIPLFRNRNPKLH